MYLLAILVHSMWAGLFSSGLGIILTGPPRYLAPTFLCGFAGCFTRDIFMSRGMNQNWSTLIAAAVVALVAEASIRRHAVSPVVFVSSVLPLGAAVAMFNMIAALMKVSSLTGEELKVASMALSANTGRVFTTSLAIAIGLWVGITIVRVFKWKEVQ